MPTYEYVCEKCNADFKENRGMNEKQENTTCAAEGCGGKLIRVFGTPPIVFKGSGFNSQRG